MKRFGALQTVCFALVCWSCGAGDSRIPLTGVGHRNLRPVDLDPAGLQQRQSVYVPIYSSIYWGDEANLTHLTAVLSVRNVSETRRLILASVAYHDSDGQRVREYIEQPSELGPLMTADFVIPRQDLAGGAGANFLVKWAAAEITPEPVIQAIMMGQIGNAGISFLTEGKTVESDRPAE